MVDSNDESSKTSLQTPPDAVESTPKLNKALGGGVKVEAGAFKIQHTMLKSKIQLVLLKSIFDTDARFIKYLILFTVLGVVISPIAFIALSLDGVCSMKECNSSHLAGFIQASQAISETVGYFSSAWLMLHVSKSNLLAVCLTLLSIRYLFYATYYYKPDVSI